MKKTIYSFVAAALFLGAVACGQTENTVVEEGNEVIEETIESVEEVTEDAAEAIEEAAADAEEAIEEVVNEGE